MKKVQRMLNFHTYKWLFCANCDVIALYYTHETKKCRIITTQHFPKIPKQCIPKYYTYY